ncbi:prephenate dehydrogenase [Bhargavaea cecembensis]|uniref:Prephenate dehydrogenase n=1 Tax=Bhargavaea cecembensis TaxID=394098 RepID=A0A165GXE6_9BACL|nr:prephenate dehydrogenase [Bhargavaea cecembensis]KZE38054.1 prephenate dehydrogenase [Bhargavaea cecembensis]
MSELKAAIIGLGLIGGSLALAIQRHGNVTVTGFDADPMTLREAQTLGVIHHSAGSAAEAAEDCDYIFFATPVNETVRMLNEAAAGWNLKKGAILSDTGSTKTWIMEEARQLSGGGAVFIGGHPMAGSHKSGVRAAREHLFENAYYLLTPADRADAPAVRKLETFLAVTKAKTAVVSAEEHDAMTAVVSHFPHVVAASLVRRLEQETEDMPFTRELAAGGFRDITRIASSDPIMWRDITLQNRDELITQIDQWIEEMNMVREMIESGDAESIHDFYGGAKKYRDTLPAKSQGALYTTFDLNVNIPDSPGAISEIAGYLAEAGISITNVRIVESRTDVFGIMVVSFQTTEDREKGRILLSDRTNYDIYIT